MGEKQVRPGKPRPDWVKEAAKSPDDFDGEESREAARGDEIARRARQMWEEAGRPEGRDEEFRDRAARDIKGR